MSKQGQEFYPHWSFQENGGNVVKKKNSLYLMGRLLSLCFEKEGKISIGIFGLAFIRSLILCP